MKRWSYRSGTEECPEPIDAIRKALARYLDDGIAETWVCFSLERKGGWLKRLFLSDYSPWAEVAFSVYKEDWLVLNLGKQRPEHEIVPPIPIDWGHEGTGMWHVPPDDSPGLAEWLEKYFALLTNEKWGPPLNGSLSG